MIFGRYAAGLCLTLALLCGAAVPSTSIAAAPTQAQQPPSQPTRDAYVAIRRQILALSPGQAFAGQPVYGAVMEFSTVSETMMVIAFPSGDVRLYRSGGGGMVGNSNQTALADAAKAFVAASAEAAPGLAAPTGYPFPAPGEVRFYVLTSAGVRTGMATRATLSTGENALTPLFTTASAVITQLRAVNAPSVAPAQ